MSINSNNIENFIVLVNEKIQKYGEDYTFDNNNNLTFNLPPKANSKISILKRKENNG
jgi:hypothetical protein